MEINDQGVFQTDSKIVNDVYAKNPGYIIEYDITNKAEYCILYFSSNNIYYPNAAEAFTESIIKKNRYEWYGNRVNFGHKHIFIRDIKKQWYLSGISAELNSPGKLLAFLQKETEGYNVIALGSSAGGFASIIYGQLLNACLIYSFNGQFEILSQLKTSTPLIDPLIFRNQHNAALLPFYDTINFIKNPETIFYFHSANSNWDKEQAAHVSDIKINTIAFNTSHHGIPFLKSNLTYVINCSKAELSKMSGKKFHPLVFSMQKVGLSVTLKGLADNAKILMNKIFKKKTNK